MAQTSRKANVTTQRRDRAVAIREEQRRQEQRRRRIVATSVVAAVVLAIGVLVGVGVGTHKKAGSGHVRTPVSASVLAAVTGVPASTFDSVGTGSGATPPKILKGITLTRGGKPELLYVGAEYCPYCAAERWAMVTALSRFGTFKNLGAITSSSTDVYPNTHTFTFYGPTYTSNYLTFQSKEVETNQAEGTGYTPLEKLDAQESQLLS